ncbi:MAG: amidohydrolase family protein, partial [Candidatus Thermoplasmatota archaeon]|nr:amidohydrolase family protein [Candidatus Thermoplasmatota archaeon]
MRTVLLNCGPLVKFDSDKPVVGSDMSNDKWITPAGKAIIIENDVIVKIMNSSEAKDDFESHTHESTKLIDLNGDAVIPGLIDSHTHLVWGGDRSREVRLKQLGYTYSEIAAKGGGINYTVRMTKEMTEKQLFGLA